MVATHFNNFFCNIAENLVNKLPPIRGKFDFNFVCNFYKDKCENSEELKFKAVSEGRIMKLLTGLNSCKATGLDCLPAKFIIDSSSILLIVIEFISGLKQRSIMYCLIFVIIKRTTVFENYLKTSTLLNRPSV